MSAIKILPPTTITLVSTFRCTAQCENCCFGCNPHTGKSMSFEQMKRYVDICYNEYKSSLRLLVITGGECMIHKDNIISIIRHASTLGLLTRIVTNAFWANSYTQARNIISELIEAGLTEINFSTGDEHNKWVPIRNVRNAAVAAARLGLKPLINIETHDNRSSSLIKKLYLDKPFIKFIQNRKIIIEHGLWMSFKNNGQSSFTYSSIKSPRRIERCFSLFSVIPINPYGEVLACCGLSCEQNSFLRLGNINKESIKTIYERSFQDILKIWLFVDGPIKILNHIAHLNNQREFTETLHTCDYCRILLNNKTNIGVLSNSYNTYATSVLLKYQLLTAHLKANEQPSI